MMIISILLKAYALLLGPIQWPMALGCWALSVVCDIRWSKQRSAIRSASPGAAAVDLIALNGSALVIGSALSMVYFQATLRW